MPPKAKGSKTLKSSKENVGATNKAKLKIASNVKKLPRKALADKTNSASDENATLSFSKPLKTTSTIKKVIVKATENPRHQRERRVPIRYTGNPVLVNLSNSNHEVHSTPVKSQVKTKPSIKKGSLTRTQVPPLKNVTKPLENSILKSRPKRICRLPSKLEGHSISPNKFIPLQPVSASTPVPNKTIQITSKSFIHNNSLDKTLHARNDAKKPPSRKVNKIKPAPDSNNNGKKQLEIDKCFEKQVQSIKSKKNVYNNSSIKLIDDLKQSLKRDSSKADPYEFTFDPDEEPPPPKKKKKRNIKKSQPKPKTIVKGIYEKNLAKALANLKKNVAMKTQLGEKSQTLPTTEPHIESKSDKNAKNTEVNNEILERDHNESNNKSTAITHPESNINTSLLPSANNYNSVRIEDIALDLQEPDGGHTIDYSPVHSPQPNPPQTPVQNEEIPVNNKDPLNLQDDVSFFDDIPVASSSMNTSVRHPLASPWRVEFGSLPIKWQVNTYVKPNMTPAVECSFINISDSNKKHVYTNIVPEDNDPLPPVADTNLKQTSIISFIKEVAERNAKKKIKSTPVKANSLFEDDTHPSLILTPTKSVSLKSTSKNSSSSHSSKSNNDINKEDAQYSTLKTPDKRRSPSEQGTFFGFESEDENQENISPVKKDKGKKALRPRSRAVLQEINDVKGPYRADLPITDEYKRSHNLDKPNEDLEDPHSVIQPPEIPDKDSEQSNVESTELNALDDGSESVHLFEDIELKHLYHQQPRKSYGKAKKVAFRQNSFSDSDDVPLNENKEQDSSEEDDLDDISFKLPVVKPTRKVKKKKAKKQKLSKKEEREVETWAAGFNSMCEDIEEFDLIVE